MRTLNCPESAEELIRAAMRHANPVRGVDEHVPAVTGTLVFHRDRVELVSDDTHAPNLPLAEVLDAIAKVIGLKLRIEAAPVAWHGPQRDNP